MDGHWTGDSHRDLNTIEPVLGWYGGTWDTARTRSDTTGRITTHFGDLIDPVVDFIRGSEIVVGCVAWLTEPAILRALSEVETAIVVQKEDFLRPDSEQQDGWHRKLRKSYGALSHDLARDLFPPPLWEVNLKSGADLDPISCVGNHNSDKRAAMPRMHHKFLVRATSDRTSGASEKERMVKPSAVWTGSFNFSKNGGRSFENAIEIHDKKVARKYLEEFSRVASLSEELDWTHDWVSPRYRIGT